MNIRVRLIACICIVSFLISLLILSQTLSQREHDPEFTFDSSGIASTNGVYFAENWDGKGYIYLIESSGNVKYMLSVEDLGEKIIDGICLSDGKVYALVHTYWLDGNDLRAVYRLFSLNPDLKPTAATDRFSVDVYEDVKELTAAQGFVYITTIGNADGAVNVYEIQVDELNEYSAGFSAGTHQEEQIDFKKLNNPKNIMFRDDSGDYIFVDAYYENGTLFVRRDIDKLEGGFVPDTRVKAAVDKIRFNLMQQIKLYKTYVLYWLGGLLIWIVVIIIVSVVLKRRNRMAYVFAITEFVFLVLLFSAVFFIQNYYAKIAKSENGRFASLALGQEFERLGDLELVDFADRDFYRSEEYKKLWKELRDFIDQRGNDDFFLDAFIVKIKDGKILVSADGHNSSYAAYEYGEQMVELLDAIKNRSRNLFEDGNYNGISTESTGVYGADPSSKYALIGIYYSGSYYTGLWSNAKSVLILAFVVFLVGSVLIIFIMFLMTMDLRDFEQAIRDVALGRTKIRVPKSPSLDMQSMWSSLSELTKRIEEINYDKYRIFEGYYRFAPKNIETIMGKESIFDVKNGDVTSTEGTLMLVSTEKEDYGDKRINSLRNIVSYMSKYSDREEGILVSEDSSLSILQFLFLQSCNTVSAQTTHFIHRNASDEESGFISVFLYYGEFLYGVVGINTQSLIFLTSEHSSEMEAYASWFERLRIAMVVTEDIVDREDPGQVRYIGYIKLTGSENKVRLYEVLDACPARERQLKLVNREKFEKTLDLFYSRDFYLARNNFSEIIKECPDDSVAKWYLFECENYLNNDADPTGSGALRISD